MRAVLDASIATSWVFPYALSAHANRIREDFSKQLQDRIAPACFSDEIACALTKPERQNIFN